MEKLEFNISGVKFYKGTKMWNIKTNERIYGYYIRPKPVISDVDICGDMLKLESQKFYSISEALFRSTLENNYKAYILCFMFELIQQ